MFDYTVDPKGIVKANGYVIGEKVRELTERFKALLDGQKAGIVDDLVELHSTSDAIPNGTLTRLGMETFEETFSRVTSTLESLECIVELDEETYKRLVELNDLARLTNPEEAIEDTFSKIILAMPMPEGK